MHMPKYIVSLTEYTFFTVPVEAENAQEAEQKAKHTVQTVKDYPIIDTLIALNDECDGDPPGVEEVDAREFEDWVTGREAA
jgi:hypothetical protein